VKIFVLNYEYPPVGGGGGRACADLCRALVLRGHEIRVLTSHASGLPLREDIDGYTINRTPTGRVDYSIATFSSMARYIFSGLFAGLSIIREWKPDILHVHFAVPTGVLGRILSMLTGVPYILTAHLGDVPGGVPDKTDRWFRFVYPFTPSIWKRAAKVVAVSTHTKQLAQEYYDVPIEVIPNGVRLASDRKGKSEDDVQRPPLIVFAGRFQPQKNLLFLVEILAGLKDLEWSCKLIGDGPQRALLDEMIMSKGLGNRIQITGWVSSDEVWELLGSSDILAMPSLSEGLPVVGVHALAQGVAIIANKAGGLVDLVDEGVNGRLCSIGDEQCFEDALRWCLEDRELLHQLKEASWRIAERFDIEHIADNYERVMAEASSR
jgi:glycosyltransferase involved in cell wall biosynthesis